MREFIERIQLLAESVTVDTSAYELSHGKPKGNGNWMFGFGPKAADSKDYLDNSKKNKTWMNARGTYVQAKKEAAKMAGELGFKVIAVLP